MDTSKPLIITIFGITGDLSEKKILPSLFELFIEGHIPHIEEIIGVARREWSNDDLKAYLLRSLPEHKEREAFISLFSYISGNFTSQESFSKITQVLQEKYARTPCPDTLYYLSVSPRFYEVIFNDLHRSGLMIPCGGEKGFARMLVEKPFGYDIGSAQHLNHLVETYFRPEQVFRIDHYVAKTSLQEIIEYRRDTQVKELWNKDHIESITIRLTEKNRVDTRGEMYDSLGVTYDVVQNHIVQMIALALRSVDQTSALEEKRQREQVIASLQVRNDFPKIRAQYEGYREHKGVSPQSETETYVEITCSSVLPLFEGVPIHIIAGKAQPTSSTSIEVHFKDGTHVSFNTEYEEKLTAYKKVLHDALTGDDRIFSSDKEVEYGWVFAHQVKEALRTVPLRVYNPD